MGSKSVLGHQNDVGRGKKRADGVFGASLEPSEATEEALGGSRAAFWRPKGDGVRGIRGVTARCAGSL